MIMFPESGLILKQMFKAKKKKKKKIAKLPGRRVNYGLPAKVYT